MPDFGLRLFGLVRTDLSVGERAIALDHVALVFKTLPFAETFHFGVLMRG